MEQEGDKIGGKRSPEGNTNNLGEVQQQCGDGDRASHPVSDATALGKPATLESSPAAPSQTHGLDHRANGTRGTPDRTLAEPRVVEDERDQREATGQKARMQHPDESHDGGMIPVLGVAPAKYGDYARESRQRDG